jgi:hypothetical protein
VANAVIVAKNPTLGGWGAPWLQSELYLNDATGTVAFAASTTAINGVALISPAADKLVVGTWAHIAATYTSSTGNIILYKNGDNIATVTLSSSGVLYWGTHGQWMIGGNDQAGAGVTSVFQGIIEDVRVENIVRSQSYLKTMYKRGMGLI